MAAEIIENINLRDKRTDGEEYLLNVFRNSERFQGWKVFEQPHINSMKPDFILLHPEKGILIIEVKDWNLSLDTYVSGAYIRGTDGKLHKKDPINQVENYKNCILKSDLQNSVYLAEKSEDYYGCIETVVYFHKASKMQALQFCCNNKGYTKIWTRDDVEYIKDINNRLYASNYTYALSIQKSKFNNHGILRSMVDELTCHLEYSDYNYERKEPFILTSAQEKLAELKHGSIRRWSGVAGAGKSLVLAEKAVRALKENNNVLILTFNITLRHYLRDLCSQQFGNGNYDGERKKLRKNLTITHFHELLKIIMLEYEIEIKNEDDIDFTQQWINSINDYSKNNEIDNKLDFDYILIDEGQDFRGEWIRFIKQIFNNSGELLIMYDKNQDLYDHGLWIENSEEIKNIGFKGTPGMLKYSYRLPMEIVEKIHLVNTRLNICEDEILIPQSNTQSSLLYSIEWKNCTADSEVDKLNEIQSIVERLLKTNVYEDITILTTNENTGVDIVNHFISRGIEVSHVYDLGKNKNINNRRSEKWKFYGGTGRLKVCSYHSFKGWQSPNIILILDMNETKTITNKDDDNEYKNKLIRESIFMSLSRVKKKALTGEFSFTCLNYIKECNKLERCFDI